MIFALGIAIGLTGGEGAAGLAAIVGYLVFNGVFNAIIPQVNGQPDPNISMGVLSGILVGVVAANLYRRFYDIRLPDYLAFFGGRRFVPIVTAFATLVLGAIFGLIWPTIQIGINAFGTWIVDLGALGVGIYGFLNRLLIPLGLHLFINDPTQIDEAQLKSLGASGVVKRGKIVQVVMGTQSDRIAMRMNRIIKARDTDSAAEQVGNDD